MAAEDKLIPTKVTITSNANLDIKVAYAGEIIKILEFFTALTNIVVNGVGFTQGDLGYTIEGYQDSFEINSDGDLIVSSEDVDKYEINANGDLILTE